MVNRQATQQGAITMSEKNYQVETVGDLLAVLATVDRDASVWAIDTREGEVELQVTVTGGGSVEFMADLSHLTKWDRLPGEGA
jgi:hypothetical protein